MPLSRVGGPLRVGGGPLDALARPQGARRTGGTRATENAASGYLPGPPIRGVREAAQGTQPKGARSV
jgi:hypothetical protein